MFDNKDLSYNLPGFGPLKVYNHWIAQEYLTLFHTKNNQVNFDNTTIPIPVEDFFNIRKISLIDYFMAIMKNNKLNPTRYDL